MGVPGLVCCVALLFVSSICSTERGFVISSNKEWIRNKTNPLLLSNFVKTSALDDFSLKIELSSVHPSDDSFYQSFDFGPVKLGDAIYNVATPDASGTFNLKVTINNSNGSYSFQKDLMITVISQEDFIYIQTNKPFYKPSDKVRIRVLTLDKKKLNPLDNKILKAYVTDSKNTVVNQWLQPTSISGIYDFELILSSEPRIGKWNFIVETQHSKKTKKFDVSRYVLPKFLVTVESEPKHLLFTYGINITYKACARYSYDKPVAGDIYFKLPDGSEYTNTLDNKGCYKLNLENYEIASFGFRFTHNLNVLVTVSEKDTGVSNSISHETQIYKAIFLKHSPFCSKHMKPGIAYKCHIQAYFDENVPAKGVKFTFYDRNRGFLDEVVAGGNGFTTLRIPPIISENFTYHSIRVGPEKPYFLVDTSKDLFLKRWISPTSTYLGISNDCDENGFVDVDPFQLTFSLVSKVPLAHQDVIFRYVVYSNGLPVEVGNFTLDFGDEGHFEKQLLSSNFTELFGNPLELQHYKHSRKIDLKGVVGAVTLLLYTEVDDEIVADSIKFMVKYKPKHQVQMKFSSQKLQPGLATELHIDFPGKSLCSLSVYDKNLEAISAVEHLKYEEILKLWKVGEPSSPRTQKSCDMGDPGNSLSSRWDPRGRPTFAGSRDAFEVDDLTVLSDFNVSKEFCRPFDFTEEAIPEFMIMSSPTGSEYPQAAVHRDFFPESWMFDLFEISEGDEGRDISLTLPHSITEWTGNGFCVGSETGLSVAPEFSIVGFQPFFLSLHLPYSVVKGERAVTPLSIHSYVPECIMVKINISHDSHLNVFKLKTYEFVVCEGTPGVVYLTIGAKKVGRANLTIKAESHPLEGSSKGSEQVNVQDSVTYTILIEPEGKPEEVSRSVYACAPASGEFLLPAPGSDVVVKDSIKSYVAVSGDLMASALANLENLLALPTGCGEQIMVKFVPNIYVLNYLKRSNLLTEEIERRAVDYLKVGYQRSLQFRRSDGSYSAFGQKDPQGSLWLTAFVLKSLAGAREYIYVDPTDFSGSLKFIQDFQFNNGCFPLVGELFQRSLMGHMDDHGSVPSVAYNAYIVSALVEAGLAVDDVSVLKGYECLESSLSNLQSNSLYDNVLLLYAHSLVRDSRQSYLGAYNRLLQHVYSESVEGKGVYWHLSDNNEAVNVETTSYVVLSFLKSTRPDLNQLLMTANWLTGKRNPQGGFYSTQDTVVALNALSTLAQHVSNPSNVTVSLATLKKVPPFVVTSTNKLLQQTVETGNLLNKKIKYSVKGDGCVSLQAVTRLNLLTFAGDQHSISVFNASVGLKSVPSSCRQMVLHVCFVYNGDGKSTNMGLVVVHLPTGWSADRESIDFLLQNSQISLMNYEIDESSIKFYFNEMSDLETCFHFVIVQDVYVLQTKPARVEIFDYYDLSISTVVEYVIYNKCSQPDKKLDTKPASPARLLRSVSNDCPSYITNPESEHLELACSKKYGFWLVKRGKEYFKVISSNYASAARGKNLAISLKAKDACGRSFAANWQEVLVSTDETLDSQNVLQLSSKDLAMELNSHSTFVVSLAYDAVTRSRACNRWRHR